MAVNQEPQAEFVSELQNNIRELSFNQINNRPFIHLELKLN